MLTPHGDNKPGSVYYASSALKEYRDWITFKGKLNPLTVRSFATRTRLLPTYVPGPAQVRTNPKLEIGSRLKPSLFLQETVVPYHVWTDVDIYEAHGLYRTEGLYVEPHGFQVNDVHVLVNGLKEAASLEKVAGYTRTDLIGANQYSVGYCGDNDWEFIRLVKLTAIGKRWCQWLSRKVSHKGKISKSRKLRLPCSLYWSPEIY